jgi:hypothetical protein
MPSNFLRSGKDETPAPDPSSCAHGLDDFDIARSITTRDGSPPPTVTRTQARRFFPSTPPNSRLCTSARRRETLPPCIRAHEGHSQANSSREVEAAGRVVAEGCGSAEHLLDRALASMAHLNEIAEAMMRRLDELLKP